MSIKVKAESETEVEAKSELELVLEKIEQLTLENLLTVQEHLTSQLRQKVLPTASQATDVTEKQAQSEQVAVTQTEGQAEDEEPDRIYLYPGSSIFRYTEKGIRKMLERMFTAEELERFSKIDLSKLPKLEKTMAEYISEDREDR
jgi:hypothetical protein